MRRGSVRGRVLLAAVLMAVTSAALAECVSVPGETELTIEHLGRVLFHELVTDRARDLAVFGGGVCLEIAAVEVTIEAERIEVRGLEDGLNVEAEVALVRLPGWRLMADSLRLDAKRALLSRTTLEGEGLVGLAEELAIDLVDGRVVARGLELLTATVRLEAARGSFDDGVLVRVEEVVASTCDCPPATASIRVEGRAAEVDLGRNELQVEAGVLIIDGVRLLLPATVRVSQAALERFEVPFTIGLDPEGRRGWVVGLAERRDRGVGFSADVALGAEADPRWQLTLSADGDGAQVVLEARDGGVAIATTSRVPLTDGVTLVIRHRSEGGALPARLQDASATLEWRGERRLAEGPVARVGAALDGTLALSAQRLSGDDVVHPRSRLAARLTAESRTTSAGRLTIGLETGATSYLGSDAQQLWASLAPSWRWTVSSLTVDAGHLQRLVWGTSPFDTRVDRVEPAARSDLRVRLAMPAGAAGHRFEAWSETRYDWRPDTRRAAPRVGLERLRFGASLRHPAEGWSGLRYSASLLVETAGIVDPRPERDAFVRAAGWLGAPSTGIEVGVASELGIGAERPGVRSLTLSGAAPLVWADGDVVLRPFLALDVWPMVRGDGGPVLAGHGLGLTWITCCGTLDLGYRAEVDGSVTTRLAFLIEPREPRLEDLAP